MALVLTENYYAIRRRVARLAVVRVYYCIRSCVGLSFGLGMEQTVVIVSTSLYRE